MLLYTITHRENTDNPQNQWNRKNVLLFHHRAGNFRQDTLFEREQSKGKTIATIVEECISISIIVLSIAIGKRRW